MPVQPLMRIRPSNPIMTPTQPTTPLHPLLHQCHQFHESFTVQNQSTRNVPSPYLVEPVFNWKVYFKYWPTKNRTINGCPSGWFYDLSKSELSTLGRTAFGPSCFNLNKARLCFRPQLLLCILRSLLLANVLSHRWQFEPSATWSCWWWTLSL